MYIFLGIIIFIIKVIAEEFSIEDARRKMKNKPPML